MITTCLLDTFWCGSQVSVNWSLDEDACNTFNSKVVFRVDWASNVATDVLSKSTSYRKTTTFDLRTSDSLHIAVPAVVPVTAS